MNELALFGAAVGLAAGLGKAFHDGNHWAAGLLFVVCYGGRMWTSFEYMTLSHICLAGMVVLAWRYLFWAARAFDGIDVGRKRNQKHDGNKGNRRIENHAECLPDGIDTFGYVVHW